MYDVYLSDDLIFTLGQVHEVDRRAEDVRVREQRAECQGAGGYDPVPQQRRHVQHQEKELREREASL